MMRFGEKYWEF